MARILVIEDEKDMQFVLSDNLEAEGYQVDVTGEGADGREKGLSGTYDLIILDIMLPDVNGIEVCKSIRGKDTATPIIMLTARGEEIDKVVGLEVGADDYITKPFGMREFLARVKAAMRRSGQASAKETQICTVGELQVNFSSREISGPGKADKLTRYESDLLQFLAASRGQAVSRERILAEVWREEPSSGNRTVDNYIARLRSKLETTPSRPQHIITVHGTGYKLV